MTRARTDAERVIEALKKVPEKRLLIIDLVNRVPLNGGDLDHLELARIQPEVNLATAEAKAYGTHTLMAVNALIRVKAVTED